MLNGSGESNYPTPGQNHLPPQLKFVLVRLRSSATAIHGFSFFIRVADLNGLHIHRKAKSSTLTLHLKFHASCLDFSQPNQMFPVNFLHGNFERFAGLNHLGFKLSPLNNYPI